MNFRQFLGIFTLLASIGLSGGIAYAQDFTPFQTEWQFSQSPSFQDLPQSFESTLTPCMRLDPIQGQALWLRFNPQAFHERQTLFIRSMGRPFQLIQNTHVLHSFGFEELGPSQKFLGFPWHAVSMGSLEPNLPAYIVTQVAQTKSGLCGEILVGPESKLTQKIATDGLDRALIASFAWIAALLGLIAAWATRSTKPYLAFSGLASSIAAWTFCSTSGPTLKLYLIPSPQLWSFVDLTGLYLTPVFLCAFYRSLLEPKGNTGRTLTIIQWGHLSFALGALVATLTGLVSPAATIRAYNQIIPVFLVIISVLAIKNTRSKEREIQLFSIGIILFMVFGIHDFLVGSGILKWKRHLNHWGLTGMLAAFLGVIWLRTRKTVLEKIEYQNTAEVNQKVAEKAKGAFHDLKTQIASLGSKIDGLNEISQERRDHLKSNLIKMRAILNLQLEKIHEPLPSSEKRQIRPACAVGGVLNVLQDDYQSMNSGKEVRIEFMIPRWVSKTFAAIPAINLHRILANLIDNAVAASLVKNSIVLVTVDRSETGIQIAVRDFGSGISDAALAAFRERRQFSSKITGHGRGLLIARELAEQVRGDLSIQSDETGTVALLNLPTCDKPEWLFEIDPNSPIDILVLDDDEGIGDRLHMTYPSATIRTFDDELDFLESASQNPTSLLLVDYSFGGLRNGLELIRAENLHHRAVLFSGRVQYDEGLLMQIQEAGVRAGLKEVLSKLDPAHHS